MVNPVIFGGVHFFCVQAQKSQYWAFTYRDRRLVYKHSYVLTLESVFKALVGHPVHFST